jgi:hypothetical protein
LKQIRARRVAESGVAEAGETNEAAAEAVCC